MLIEVMWEEIDLQCHREVPQEMDILEDVDNKIRKKDKKSYDKIWNSKIKSISLHCERHKIEINFRNTFN